MMLVVEMGSFFFFNAAFWTVFEKQTLTHHLAEHDRSRRLSSQKVISGTSQKSQVLTILSLASRRESFSRSITGVSDSGMTLHHPISTIPDPTKERASVSLGNGYPR